MKTHQLKSVVAQLLELVAISAQECAENIHQIHQRTGKSLDDLTYSDVESGELRFLGKWELLDSLVHIINVNLGEGKHLNMEDSEQMRLQLVKEIEDELASQA